MESAPKGVEPSVPRTRLGVEYGRGVGIPAHPRRLLDAPKRPAQPAKCQYLLSFLVAQDVCHGLRETTSARRPSTSQALTPLAAFQTSTYGRFWVSTEACNALATR